MLRSGDRPSEQFAPGKILRGEGDYHADPQVCQAFILERICQELKEIKNRVRP